jgi:putative OPT family oligopeptide transporter
MSEAATLSPDKEQESEQKYQPAEGEKQLTARAIIVGCLVGSIVSCTNIYIGLKIGWTFGASIVSAVLGFAFFSAFRKNLSVLETNITQTAGSAAGGMASAAGLVAAIPAMEMLGYEIPWQSLMLWSLSIAFLGVFFAVPLRRQVVEIDKLRFPTGTATAETILAMVSEAGEAAKKARVLIWAGLGAGAFTLLAHFVPQLESPPLHKWLDIGILTVAASWGFKLYLGPSLFGAGFLIGPRVSISLAIGAVSAWALIGPGAQAAGWAPGPVMSYADGARGWLLWPGVALMVSEALTSLVLSWKTFVRALKMPTKIGSEDGQDDRHIPNSWWMGGLAAGSVLTSTIAYTVFDIPVWMTIIAIMLSAVLSIVAVRSVGETDINPIGGMGKVTQLVYGGLAPGQMSTNLMAAAITGAGASQAGDMMQDLKTGHLLGASPRKQFIAQLFGICAGVVFVVPVYYIFTSAYEIGSDKIPAPAAMAWKAMAELLAKGFEALPPHATEAVLIAGIIGASIPLLRKIESIKKWVPSGLAMGIAFIIPAFYSLVMFYGMLVWWIWKMKRPSAVEKFNFAMASGLVAGEGLMGIVNAVLTILGIPS